MSDGRRPSAWEPTAGIIPSLGGVILATCAVRLRVADYGSQAQVWKTMNGLTREIFLHPNGLVFRLPSDCWNLP